MYASRDANKHTLEKHIWVSLFQNGNRIVKNHPAAIQAKRR